MEDEKRQSTVKDAHGQKNNQSQLNNNHKIALCGVLIALAMILSYLESLVPIHMAVPGVKLGLANLVTGSEVDGCNLGRTYHPVECSVRKYGGVTIQSGRCGMQHPDHDGTKKMPGIRTCRN